MMEQFEQLLEQLVKIRETHGDEAWEHTRRQIARSVVLNEKGLDFIRRAWPDMDVEKLAEEAKAAAKQALLNDAEPRDGGPGRAETAQQAKDVGGAMVEMLRQQMPSMKTQAQFNCFMLCFDALRAALDSAFKGEVVQAMQFREALNKGLDASTQLRGIAEQVEEMPAEIRSKDAQAFVDPPAQFEEQELHARLLSEIGGIDDYAKLTQWYGDNRKSLDRILTQSLRNDVFDAIRRRQEELKK